MNPDSFAPPVQDPHRSLIDILHGAIRSHPHPERKASYAKMLHQALADQARDHASAQAPGGAPAGNPQGGPGLSPGAEAVGPQGGYIDQNVTPLQAMLTSQGGIANMHPGALPGGGSLAALLAALGQGQTLAPGQAWT